VIASGGVSSLDDPRELKQHEELGIVGRRGTLAVRRPHRAGLKLLKG
jgi:phosphoribosylformimino-5-aminoimidazole carboxamide ribonucleotide (ProFAR) isomerase